MRDRRAEYLANQESVKARSRDWYYANQEKAKKARNDYYHRNKVAIRHREMLKKYGLSAEQFSEILERQGGSCAICPATVADSRNGNLHVDHDHSCCPGDISCGKCLRGLLCMACNNVLGRFSDDAERLDRAAAYLRQYREEA